MDTAKIKNDRLTHRAKSSIQHWIDDKVNKQSMSRAFKNVEQFTRSYVDSKKLWYSGLSNSKKIGIKIGGSIGIGLLAANIATRAATKVYQTLFFQGPEQRYYEYQQNQDRSSFNLKETMTDFGSPVKLSKTVSKTITPYKSTVRDSTVTTRKAVIASNVNFIMHSQAIKHNRY